MKQYSIVALLLCALLCAALPAPACAAPAAETTGSIVFCTQTDSDGKPVDPGTTFAVNQKVALVISLPKSDRRLVMELESRPDGTTSTFNWEAGLAGRRMEWSWSRPGSYTVSLYSKYTRQMLASGEVSIAARAPAQPQPQAQPPVASAPARPQASPPVNDQPPGADDPAPPASVQPPAGGTPPPAEEPPAGQSAARDAQDPKGTQDSKDQSSPPGDPASPGGAQDAVNPDDWAYASFQLLMNWAFGRGNWSDRGHSFDDASNTLSVNDIAMQGHRVGGVMVQGRKVGGTKYPSGKMAAVRMTAPMRPERLRQLLSGNDQQGRDAAPVAERVVIKDMLLDMEVEKKDNSLTMASFQLANPYLSGKTGELTAEGMTFRAQRAGATTSMDWGLLKLVNLDCREVLNGKAAPGKDDSQTFEKFLSEVFDFNSLGTLFVSSFSLDQGLAKDVKIIDGGMTIRLAEGRADGPVQAGKIPPKFVISLTGLAVDLPADPQAAAKAGLGKLHELGKMLGMSTVVMDIETLNSYDERTATLTRDLTKLNFRDLFDWSMRVRINGMTPQRLEILRKTRFKDTLRAFLDPKSELANLALEDFSFKFADRSLFDRLYASKKIQKQQASAMGKQVASQYSTIQIAQALVDFFNDPGTLALSVTPSPPLSTLSAVKMADLKVLLNSLNMVLTVNDKSSQPVVFKQAPAFGGRRKSP